MLNLRPLIATILDQYVLPPVEIHGVAHWARVMENGLRLARATAAKIEVVQLFAVLHDSKRENEGHDPDHGQRGADFACSLWGKHFHLDDGDFDLLCEACAGHTHERTHPDITIQTCWDADRLDLGRVGILPEPSRLCTDVAKSKEMIRWANRRACSYAVPDFVLDEWGIDLENSG
jgi:uncharacterized protein